MALAVHERECGRWADDYDSRLQHGFGLTCRDNEVGYMFYHDLGGPHGNDKRGTQTALGGQQLTGIQRYSYWSGTEATSLLTWDFFFVVGDQFGDDKVALLSAWAVRPGDVAAVPEPSTATVLLIGVGMLGLMVWMRQGHFACNKSPGLASEYRALRTVPPSNIGEALTRIGAAVR